MLCSIIIPLYNKGVYIEFAIQSVLRQTYQKFEVIVIDDGSTDDGPSRVRAISDDRIQCHSQQNSGVSSARNAGISLAKGNLICFLDADDWYFPEYLASVVKMAQDFPHAQAFATNFARQINPNETIGQVGKETEVIPELITDLFETFRHYGAIFCTNSIALRATYLKTMQPCFPTGENLGEDLDLWFRVATKHQIVYKRKPLVGYRVQVEGSLCTSAVNLSLLPVFRRLSELAKDKTIERRIRFSMNLLAADAKVTMARQALTAGKRGDAITAQIFNQFGPCVRRWWLTWIFCFIPMSSAISYWGSWRSRKNRNTN